MQIKCPHCGKENKIPLRFVYNQECAKCKRRVDQQLSKMCTCVKLFLMELALLPIIIDDAPLFSIRFWGMCVLTIILVTLENVIFMKFAYRLNQNK